MDEKKLFFMQQAYGTLFSVTNKIQAKGDETFKNLTSRQMMVIVAIVHLKEDETTINNIARKLGTTKQSTKQMISSMESKGYIKTIPSKSDKRAVNIRITELGEIIALECGEKALGFFETLFNNFTEEEVEMLWTLLKKLYSFDGEEQDGFEENMHFGEEKYFEKYGNK